MSRRSIRVKKMSFEGAGGWFSAYTYLLQGLAELGYKVKLVDSFQDADIAFVGVALLSEAESKVVYAPIEGFLERRPEVRARKAFVVTSRFSYECVGGEADGIVYHGVPRLSRVGELVDVAVSVSGTTDSGVVRKFHTFRKNVEAYVSLLKRYRLSVACNKWFPHPELCDIVADRPYLYARALLYLSRAEGFGLPVAEAMASGVPVAYLDAPAYNEFAQGEKIPAVFRGFERFTLPRAPPMLVPSYEPASLEAVYFSLKRLLGSRRTVEYRPTPRDMAQQLVEEYLLRKL
ncbi:glycosyltransferase [Pyrobaculum sp.]|uniref:glycosyltransferase n=1 Tax=Pyrobaculum sp. TaxID=2004705 RepID=UPI003D1340E6